MPGAFASDGRLGVGGPRASLRFGNGGAVHAYATPPDGLFVGGFG